MLATKHSIFLHYKQKLYNVLDIVIDHRTNKKMVLYNAMYDDKRSWLRPYDMFHEKINFDGKDTNRFTYVGELSEPKNKIISNNCKLTLDTTRHNIQLAKHILCGFATHTESQEDYVIYSKNTDDKMYAITIDDAIKFNI